MQSYSIESIGRCDDFDVLIEDGLYLLEALTPENLKAKKKKYADVVLHYPRLIYDLNQALSSLIEEAREYDMLFMRMAYHSQKYLQRYLEKEEIRNYDSLLKDMQKAAQSPAFVHLIGQKYKAAIIDEFQDTDPLQWDIFEKLFLNQPENWGYLYLVGDPKQAIYSFRQADIYTYLKAGQLLGAERTACLKTNFRSQKNLIEALNFMFSACPQLIHLPRGESHLEYQSVKAGEKHAPRNFNDSLGSVHFLPLTVEKKKISQKDLKAIELDHFLSYIIQQILSLKSQAIALDQMAILVADRYQCQRTSDALAAHNIPCITQHQERLADSPVITALKDILAAVLSPKDEASVKIALGGPLIGWSNDKILLLNQSKVLEQVLIIFFHLHTTWVEQGFSAFFNELMAQIFPFYQGSIAEALLSREDGLELYQDLLQISDILIEYEKQHPCSVQEILSHLDHFLLTQSEEEQSIKRRPNPDLKGVHILTTHSSKGLEYDIVFALGLSQRSRQPGKKKLDTSHYPPLMVPIQNENSREYLEVCEEADAEKMRLFYVALTRAKQRVYIPALFLTDQHSLKPGTASPLELYLARIGADAPDYNDLYHRVSQLNQQHLEALYLRATNLHIDMTLTTLPSHASCTQNIDNTASPQLIPPKDFVLPGTFQSMHSYSSLTKSLSHETEASEMKPPMDLNQSLKTTHTLPSGTDIGLLLHKILECVPLGCLDDKEIKKIISQEVRGTLWSSWADVIEQMIHNALKCRFHISDAAFCLADIDSHKVYREMEFIFPWLPDLHFEEFGSSKGFLKGVIDLLFEHKGKYYILDWKSNWLGPSVDYYTSEFIEKAMSKHHYFIQAQIYQEALKKYLHIADQQPFHDIFGGVIYVFLRGLDPQSHEPESHPPKGIFIINP